MENNENVARKYNEYKIKITKIAGYLSDYQIDQAIESEDYSFISGALIDYFLSKDVGYLLSRFKEFELDKKIEDIDFDIMEWYRVKDAIHTPSKLPEKKDPQAYIQELVEKRKQDTEE